MPARSPRSPTAAAKTAPAAPPWPNDLAEADASRAGPTTQVPLFPASELEPAAPVPRRRLARLKTLLLAFDARRKDARRTVKLDEHGDPLHPRAELWLDSFFDH